MPGMEITGNELYVIINLVHTVCASVCFMVNYMSRNNYTRDYKNRLSQLINYHAGAVIYFIHRIIILHIQEPNCASGNIFSRDEGKCMSILERLNLICAILMPPICQSCLNHHQFALPSSITSGY